ncbi:MAG: hypothetical protein J7M21_05290 [Planctomycetes bacterium]|nr:hypothetical protein [Planctomycetota bacterium]
MPANIVAVVLGAVLSLPASGSAQPAGPETAAELGADDAVKAVTLWRQLRRADADSADFKAAQWKLAAILGTMAPARRTPLAVAMMDPSAPPSVNAAALELFGKDPLPLADVQRILWDSQRSDQERQLLKTYYSFCRPEAPEAMLSEQTRRQLVDLLAERLANLAGSRVNYGEQRLFVHLTSDVLSRYGRQAASVPQAKGLLRALETYAAKAGKTDSFAAAIPDWLALLRGGWSVIDTFSKAVRALGHWEPLVRLKAITYLAELVPTDVQAARVVVSLMNDQRDEVRAAAARVFAVAKDYRPDVIVPAMVTLLTRDRGAVVQAAAEEVLLARADQAAGQIGPLLGCLTSPSRRLGAHRTSHILTVLASLIGNATADQRAELLDLATRRLATSPDGALAVMRALGPAAAKALPAIRQYRASADRFRREYIDSHVLPAIVTDESS